MQLIVFSMLSSVNSFYADVNSNRVMNKWLIWVSQNNFLESVSHRQTFLNQCER